MGYVHRHHRYAVAGLITRQKIAKRTAKRLLYNIAAVMRADGVEPLRRKGRLIDPRTGGTIASIESAGYVWNRR